MVMHSMHIAQATLQGYFYKDELTELTEGLQARAREAEERSRKILDEEKAKDAAWRQAVKMVSLSPSGNSAAGAAM